MPCEYAMRAQVCVFVCRFRVLMLIRCSPCIAHWGWINGGGLLYASQGTRIESQALIGPTTLVPEMLSAPNESAWLASVNGQPI